MESPMTQPPVEPPGDNNSESQPGAGSPDDLPDPIEPTEHEIAARWTDDGSYPSVDEFAGAHAGELLADAWLAKPSAAERAAGFEGGYAVDHETDWEAESERAGFEDGGPLDEMPPGPIL